MLMKRNFLFNYLIPNVLIVERYLAKINWLEFQSDSYDTT